MRNVWIFAQKEFLLNVRSSRFVVGLLLCLVIVLFTMIVSVSDYQIQKEVCEAEARQAGEEMRSCLVWSKVSPKLVREPEPLSLLSRGITNNVGYIVSIDLWEIPFLPLQFNWAQNSPFMKVFPPFDFSAVLSVMISLLALVFSYDAVTREREEGTLRFIFSSSVSRYSFLLGKWLGVVLTVLPILLACFLLALGLGVLGMDGRRVDVFGFVCLFGFLCLVRYLGVVADGPVGNLNRALYAQLADIPVRDSGFVLLRFPEHGGLALL